MTCRSGVRSDDRGAREHGRRICVDHNRLLRPGRPEGRGRSSPSGTSARSCRSRYTRASIRPRTVAAPRVAPSTGASRTASHRSYNLGPHPLYPRSTSSSARSTIERAGRPPARTSARAERDPRRRSAAPARIRLRRLLDGRTALPEPPRRSTARSATLRAEPEHDDLIVRAQVRQPLSSLLSSPRTSSPPAQLVAATVSNVHRRRDAPDEALSRASARTSAASTGASTRATRPGLGRSGNRGRPMLNADPGQLEGDSPDLSA